MAVDLSLIASGFWQAVVETGVGGGGGGGMTIFEDWAWCDRSGGLAGSGWTKCRMMNLFCCSQWT